MQTIVCIKQSEVDEELVKMIALDLQPFSIKDLLLIKLLHVYLIMQATLKLQLRRLDGSTCIAHNTNLIVWEGLKQLKLKQDAVTRSLTLPFK